MSRVPHHRQSTRLQGYDYRQAGGYFVTIVTVERAARFGTILNGEMRLNAVGQMALREWQALPGRFAGLELDAFVIMPNHIHGVLLLCPSDSIPPSTNNIVGAQRFVRAPKSSMDVLRPSDLAQHSPLTGDAGCGDCDVGRVSPHVDPGSLGAIVRTFKSSTTLRFHRMRAGDRGPQLLRTYPARRGGFGPHPRVYFGQSHHLG